MVIRFSTDAAALAAFHHWLAVRDEGVVMVGEIAVVPQVEGPARALIGQAVGEIAGQGLRYEVGAASTAVEGDLDAILGAVRAIERRLRDEGVERALIDVRLQLEPHPETLEHQVEGVAPH